MPSYPIGCHQTLQLRSRKELFPLDTFFRGAGQVPIQSGDFGDYEIGLGNILKRWFALATFLLNQPMKAKLQIEMSPSRKLPINLRTRIMLCSLLKHFEDF